MIWDYYDLVCAVHIIVCSQKPSYDEVSLILCALMSNAWSCARIISILKGCNVNGYLYFIIRLVVLPLL